MTDKKDPFGNRCRTGGRVSGEPDQNWARVAGPRQESPASSPVHQHHIVHPAGQQFAASDLPVGGGAGTAPR